MPAIGNIVIHDDSGSANPRTFKPVLATGENSSWVCDDGNITASAMTIDMRFRPRTSQRPTNRVNISFAMPKEILDTDTGVHSVQSVARASFEVVVPDDFDDTDAESFAYIWSRLAAVGFMFNAVSDNEAVY